MDVVAHEPEPEAPQDAEPEAALIEEMIDGEPGPDGDACTCDVCGFEAKNELGLRMHALQKHRGNKKKAKKKKKGKK
ncbi:MAG: hypothetical protein ACYTEQ_01485 [Planctomycetota bacterium]|jgi:hypothetical protein